MRWAVQQRCYAKEMGYDTLSVTHLGPHRVLAFSRKDGSAQGIFSPEAAVLVREHKEEAAAYLGRRPKLLARPRLPMPTDGVPSAVWRRWKYRVRQVREYEENNYLAVQCPACPLPHVCEDCWDENEEWIRRNHLRASTFPAFDPPIRVLKVS
jgi:hypothetical protein